MSTYLFVAGAWHNSWSEIVPLLEGAGHRVLTPDLIGMPTDEETATEEPLRKWTDQIAAIISEESEPVVLVGHSRAGIVISEVAERVPHRIDLLVYLCAFMLEDGQTLNDVASRHSGAEALAEAIMNQDDGTMTFDPTAVKAVFYADAPEHLALIACERVVPEPTISFLTPVSLTRERFGSVPRVYVECTEDRAIPLAAQRAMQEALPMSKSVSLVSDHSPFFSRPTELVAALEELRRHNHQTKL